MTIFFSKTTNSFYPEDFKEDYVKAGTWPEDAIEVGEVVHGNFTKVEPPAGKKLGSNKAGKPAWVALTKAESSVMAEAEERYWRDNELHRADVELLKSEDGDGVGEPVEWRAYRKALRAYTDTEGFPFKPKNRPVAPDAGV